jgi:hypothetical protein
VVNVSLLFVQLPVVRQREAGERHDEEQVEQHVEGVELPGLVPLELQESLEDGVDEEALLSRCDERVEQRQLRAARAGMALAARRLQALVRLVRVEQEEVEVDLTLDL